MFVFYSKTYLCIPVMCLVPGEVRKVIECPGTGVMGGCELPCGCWDPNSGPLQDQQETAEPLCSPFSLYLCTAVAGLLTYICKVK